jgi:hypothetical protein
VKIKIEQGEAVSLKVVRNQRHGIDSEIDMGSMATVLLQEDDTLYISSPCGRRKAVQVLCVGENGKLAIKIHDNSQVHNIEDAKGKKLL